MLSRTCRAQEAGLRLKRILADAVAALGGPELAVPDMGAEKTRSPNRYFLNVNE